MNIKNEIFLKITKILFNIFSFIFIVLMGFSAYLFFYFAKTYNHDLKLYEESLKLTLNIIQNFIC